MKQATTPDAVAEAIYEAVTTSAPRLRWVVGDDARRLLEGGRRMTDEEVIADGRPSSDEEWRAVMRRRCGFEFP